MVVIMDYDMADHGRYNPDSSRKSQEGRPRHTAPSQKKNIQTTMKQPAEISVTPSTAWQGITKNRNKRSTVPLRV
jgi:hypothetical protein